MNDDRVKNQSGMVLLFCLIFLTALTLLGLSASSDAVLQNQLAANLQETTRAKQSALAALSWAENWLLDLEGMPPSPCTASCEGLKLHAGGELPPYPEFESFSWWQVQGLEAGMDPLSGSRLATVAAGSTNPPMWIIEVIHEIPAVADDTTATQSWYRILARGNGQTDSSVSVVESIVTRYWPSDETTAPDGEGRVSWRQLR